MPEVNVLVVGDGISVPNIRNSKYLKKLYVAGEHEVDGAVLIKFNTFKELAQKCKALQIDIVLVEEEKWILQGIADVLRKNYVNCIAPTSKITDLKLHSLYAKESIQRYGICVPKTIKLPVDYPIMLKSSGFIQRVDSMQELIDLRKNIGINYPQLAETSYLEQFLEGEKITVTSLFDGKHLITFPNDNISAEVLNNYSKNLEAFLTEEKSDFTGFINSELILHNDNIFNTGFNFGFINPNSDTDILFILWSCIYQKLNEITF